MDLTAWLTAGGTGAINRLAEETGLSHPVIARARKGRATLASAAKIYLATGCRVHVASMTRDEVPDGFEHGLRLNARRQARERKAAAAQ